MNGVACIASGGSRFSATGNVSEHMVLAAQNAILSAPGIEVGDVDGVFVSTNENGKYLAASLSESLKIGPKCAYSVENLCSSGSNAITSAYAHIRAGLLDVALVVGADGADSPGLVFDSDVSRGRFVHPIYWASLFTSSYKRKYGAKPEHIASVSSKNHLYATDNPLASYPADYSVRDVLESKKITGDLRLYECSRPCTGASSIILASQKTTENLGCRAAWISGIGQKTCGASISSIRDFSSMQTSYEAAREAISMAGMRPEKIDVAEVHDAFAVCEPMVIESVGMAEKGKGAELSYKMYEERSRRVNPRGGLLGAGHPLGATGVAQVAEITAQLFGRAGNRQVRGARAGLVHNMSAAATSSTVLVFKDER